MAPYRTPQRGHPRHVRRPAVHTVPVPLRQASLGVQPTVELVEVRRLVRQRSPQPLDQDAVVEVSPAVERLTPAASTRSANVSLVNGEP